MKKKILSLLLVFTLVLSNFTVASAAESLERPSGELIDSIKTISGAEALAEIGKDKTVFLDLRAKEDAEAGPIAGAISAPVCNADYSVTTDNKDAFIKQFEGDELKDKTVYLSCYMGTFCVDYAIDWLVNSELGISANQLVRVTGGTFTDPALAEAALVRVPADTALAAANSGNGIILDVRAADVYYNTAEGQGYIDGSLHQPLFKDANAGVTDRADELTANFNAFVEANKTLLTSKPIYILCNGGKSGAAAATYLLVKAGLPSSNIFTIEGGAGKLYGTGALVQQQFVSAEDTIAAIGSKDVVILNVRTTENYEKGHLKGALSYPVFNANGVTSGYDQLAKDFLAKVAANPSVFEGKDIYVVCNGGARGAKAATKLLMQAGYSNSDIFTVEKGYSNPVIAENSVFVPSVYAMNAANNGNGIILDVRATEVYYEDGYIDGSLHQPLFNRVDGQNKVTDRTDDLAKNFNAFVDANKDVLANNNVYILCNGGASGAAAATALLKQAGITGNVFTIEGGANAMKADENLKNFLVKQQFVSAEDTIKAIGSKDVVILNVRTKEDYEKGHLKGAYSYPVFNANGVTSGYDQLAKDFLAKVAANPSVFEGKDIYVVCNGGARGAKAATKLLMQAGYSNSNIYTVEKGYSNPIIAENSTSVINPEDTTTKPVQTGDSSSMMLYTTLMLAAALVVMESKKRFAAK